jgi:D-beta-D-heptose 7-phosphate kinase/D-beta-D-heptose 1-phosphate adenosyltransferase
MIYERTSLAFIARMRLETGRPIVFTNGCFDILVPQHVKLLEVCAGYGFTVVSVDSNARVKALKGPGRPIMGEDERATIVDRIKGVGAVFVNGDPSPLAAILEIRPDYLVKGEEWPESTIIGAQDVRGWGGQVIRVPNRSPISRVHSSNVVCRVLEMAERAICE